MFFRNKIIKVGDYKYMCGATINSSGDYDILLSKFDNNVDTLIWSVSYDGSYNGDDFAADLVVDGSNNIIVVGTTQVGSLDYNAITIKYNTSGTQQWASTYAGAASGPDGLTSVYLDGSDIYVAGGAVVSALQLTDMLCIKYNSSGTQQWLNTWNNGSANLQDGAVEVSIRTGDVWVVDATQESTSPVVWKTAQVKYNPSTGAFVSSSIAGGTTSAFSEVKDIAVDDSDRIYVCGTKVVSGQGKNIHVVRYNTNLTESWSYTKNGSASADDEGVGLELSGSYVFVTGYTSITSQGRNIYAARLAQSNGAMSWEINNNLAGGDDEATGLQMDANNNLIIPCVVDRNSTKDIGLLKLNHSTGAVITSSFYNSESNRNDYARDIAVNHTNNDVYISAQIQVNDSTYESRIIKWKQTKVYSPVPTDAYSSYGGYIPNNTQLRETDSTANRTVKFYNQSNAIATYIDDSKISYQLLLANDTTDADTTFRVDMALIGGKPNAKVYPYNERSEYINYYLGHMDKPSIRTPLSNVVLKQDVYTSTDVLFSSSPTGFRHWFIARTGATPTGYQMSFTGQTGLSVDGSGNLVVATTIGNITYKKAKAYSMNTTTGALTVLGWQPSYSISSGVVSFTSVGAWSGTLVLEVDEKEPAMMGVVPESNENLEWSSFFGGSGEETNRDVANAEDGRVWYCGDANLTFALQSNGEVTGTVLGSYDAYVAFFNEDCRSRWMTFYGGSELETGYGIAIDPDGNSYFVGATLSEGLGIFEPAGINDTSLGGTSDGFFLKLDDEGQIVVDSYIGGSGGETAYDVAYRGTDAGATPGIFIVGGTDSGSDFPIIAAPDAYNQSYGGNGDGFLMELNTDCQPKWSTYYGGSGFEAIYGIENVGACPTLIGMTNTSDYSTTSCDVPGDNGFPSCAPNGSWQQALTGSVLKYFTARFNSNRVLVHSSFFGRGASAQPLYFKPTIATTRRAYTTLSGKHFFYLAGRSFSNTAAQFPFVDWTNSGYPDPYYYDNNDYTGNPFHWVAQLYFEADQTKLEGSTAMNWNDGITHFSIAVDRNDGPIVVGSTTVSAIQDDNEYCSLPDDNEFPICDHGEQLYVETNVNSSNFRSFIIQFDFQMNLVWATQFGNNPINAFQCASSAGDFIFAGGYSQSNHTLWNYDTGSTLDYYRGFKSGLTDATVARFARPQAIIVGVEENEQPENIDQLLVFPNPTTGMLNIKLPSGIGHDGNVELYDAQGKLIVQRKSTQNFVMFDVGQLAPGMYTVKYINGANYITKSFIKE